MHHTPLLIDVHRIDFSDYISSLSKSAKKNYKYALKKNQDLEYKRIPFNAELVTTFMELWEKQSSDDNRMRWAFGLKFLEYLNNHDMLMLFAARERANTDNVLAIHFLENHNGFIECHTPIYDKNLHSKRYIAKYMWFNLIEESTNDPTIKWLDLGGGENGNWKNLIKLYNNEKSKSYKWHFVPIEVKKYPEKSKEYVIKLNLFPYGKQLVEQHLYNSFPSYDVRKKIVNLFYYRKKSILSRAISKIW